MAGLVAATVAPSTSDSAARAVGWLAVGAIRPLTLGRLIQRLQPIYPWALNR